MLESKDDAQLSDIKERLRQSEEARAADSTAFKARMTEANALLASSKAALAEQQKSSAQRISSCKAQTEHATGELSAAKTSWADERQKTTAIITDVKQAAIDCTGRLVSTERALASRHVVADEHASAAEKKTAGLEAKDVSPKENLTESERAERTSRSCESMVKEAHEAMIRIRGGFKEKAVLAIQREAALTECKEQLVAAETKAAGLEANIVCLEEELKEAKSVGYTSLAREFTLQKKVDRLHHVLAENMTLVADKEAALTECKKRLASAEESMTRQQAVAAERASAAKMIPAGLEAKDMRPKENLTEYKRTDHPSLSGESTVKEAFQALIRIRGLLTEKVALEDQREAALKECKDRLVSAQETMAMQQVEAEERALAAETKATGMGESIARLENDLVESKRTEHVSLARECALEKEVIRLLDVIAENTALEAHREVALTECKERLVSAEESMATHQVTSAERESSARSKAAGLEASIACLKQDLTVSKRAEHTALAREITLHKEVVGLQNVLSQKRALEVDREETLTDCKERLVSTKETMAMQQVEAEQRALMAETEVAGNKEIIACLERDLGESKHAEHASLARESTLQMEVVRLHDIVAEKTASEAHREAVSMECKERLVSAEQAMARQQVAADDRESGAETKAVRLEATITRLEDDLTESRGAKHANRARKSTLRDKVAGSQVVLAEKSVLEVDREATLTQCKEGLVSVEETMAMPQVEAAKSALAIEAKTDGLKATIAFLDDKITESKRAEHASSARESILQKDMAGLDAEKSVLEADRKASLTLERGLQEVVNNATAQSVIERGARDAERTKSLQCNVKLTEEASALKLCELSARKATGAMQKEREPRALAEKVAELELKTSLVKSRRALLAEQVASSARSLTVKKEHASQLRDVRESLMLCKAARKEEQEAAALTLSNSEEKATKLEEQLVTTKDALGAERSEMTARFAMLQRQSVKDFQERKISAGEKMKALTVVAHQRETRMEAEMASMGARLAVAEERFSSEHAENIRLSSRLHVLGQDNDTLMQRLLDAENTLETQRTKATADLHVVHEELGKLQNSAEKENKQNTALVERFAELEREQCCKLKTLMFEAATLAKERDTAKGLLKDQKIARMKERTTAATEISALKKVLNDLGKLELAEERSLQMDRSVIPAIDGDYGRRGTAAVPAGAPPRFEVRTTGLGSNNVETHAISSSLSCREPVHSKQGIPSDTHVRNTKQYSIMEEESRLSTSTGHEPFRGTRSACTIYEAPSGTVSPAMTVDPSTKFVEKQAIAPLQSSTSRRKIIYPEQGLPPGKHVRDPKQGSAIKDESHLSPNVEHESFLGTTLACARDESSPATISAVCSTDIGTRAVRNYAVKPQRLSKSCLERVCLEQGPSPDEYARNAKRAPSVKEEPGLATGAKYEPFQRPRLASARGGSFSTSVSPVTSTDPGTRSVENQAMVPQGSSVLNRELIHFDQNLLPDNFVGNTGNAPATKDKDGLAVAYTRDESCHASVSSVRSTDLGTRSAENDGIAPQPSSVSRDERIYLYPNQSLWPAKCALDAEKVTTIMETSDLATGAVYNPIQKTRLVCTRGESSSTRVSSRLVSGTELYATEATTKILRSSVPTEELRLGQERDRTISSTRPFPTRSKALSSLNDRWLAEEPAEVPESVQAKTILRQERFNGNMRTVGTGVSGSDGHASFSPQGKYVIDIGRFQDTGSRIECAGTLSPRSPNHRARNGQEKPNNSTMQGISGWVEAVIDEVPASAHGQREGRFDTRVLGSPSQLDTPLLAAQILNEHEERGRTTTDNGPLGEGIQSRSEHISSALNPYTPRQSTRRESKGGTTTSR